MPLPIGLKILLDKEIMPTLASSRSADSKILYLSCILDNTEWPYEICKVNKKLFIFIKVNNQIYKVTNNGIRRLAVIKE